MESAAQKPGVGGSKNPGSHGLRQKAIVKYVLFKGTVTSAAEMNSVINGAQVSIEPLGIKTVTDSLGRFSFKLKGADLETNRIIVSCAQYATWSKPLAKNVKSVTIYLRNQLPQKKKKILVAEPIERMPTRSCPIGCFPTINHFHPVSMYGLPPVIIQTGVGINAFETRYIFARPGASTSELQSGSRPINVGFW